MNDNKIQVWFKRGTWVMAEVEVKEFEALLSPSTFETIERMHQEALEGFDALVHDAQAAREKENTGTIIPFMSGKDI